ncbi:MAG: signal peptidase I [Lachnospiraceae bacterium]|nr:signal peptidase I [Lachnospiraceae bacterium]
MENQKKTSVKDKIKSIVEWLIYFLIIFVVAYLLLNFIAQRTLVDGSSMSPTLHNKDSVIVDKLSYRFSDPERFDIVVFRYLPKDDTYYIKRIIGLPGETVQIIDGYVYINGELLESDIYGSAVMNSAGRASEPITLGEYEYFVLGDNRNGSSDSRIETVGNVEISQIVGKAFVRIWPISDFEFLKHQ